VASLAHVSKPRKRKVKPWTVEEARRFLESAKRDQDPLYAAYVLILVMGLRKGEVVGLPWSAVARSAVGAPIPASGPDARRREPRPGGSRVHCDSLDEVGARLCPCGIAAGTPQTFPAASLAADRHMPRQAKKPVIGRRSGEHSPSLLANEISVGEPTRAGAGFDDVAAPRAPGRDTSTPPGRVPRG
jgi:hypothetical protein